MSCGSTDSVSRSSVLLDDSSSDYNSHRSRSSCFLSSRPQSVATKCSSANSSGTDSSSSSRSSSRSSLDIVNLCRSSTNVAHHNEDSISAEVVHFEPIQRSPRTPPRVGNTYAPILHIKPCNKRKISTSSTSSPSCSTKFLEEKLREFTREKEVKVSFTR